MEKRAILVIFVIALFLLVLFSKQEGYAVKTSRTTWGLSNPLTQTTTTPLVAPVLLDKNSYLTYINNPVSNPGISLLNLAIYDGSAVTTQVLDSSSSSGGLFDLSSEIDASNMVHIAYLKLSGLIPVIIYKKLFTSISEVVTAPSGSFISGSPSAQGSLSLAVGPGNTPYLALITGGTFTRIWLTKRTTNWMPWQMAVQSNNILGPISLSVDPIGNAYILYYEYSPNPTSCNPQCSFLKLAKVTPSGTVTITTVAVGPSTTWFSGDHDIESDTNGVVHIAWIQQGGILQYSFGTTSFSPITLDSFASTARVDASLCCPVVPIVGNYDFSLPLPHHYKLRPIVGSPPYQVTTVTPTSYAIPFKIEMTRGYTIGVAYQKLSTSGTLTLRLALHDPIVNTWNDVLIGTLSTQVIDLDLAIEK